jgi:DNA-binding NtrC family response regulator
MANRLHLLVVDDDPDFIRDFSVLGREEFKISEAVTGEKALSLLDDIEPDAVILDLRLGTGIDGLETLRRIRVTHPDIPVIMVTDYASVETAVKAIKLGAFHYMSKSPNMKELHAIIQRELRYINWKNLLIEENRNKYGELVGSTPVMKELHRTISRIAESDLSVLIEGESGTGKELVAREIHLKSQRSSHPFVPINCAAIPVNLFESELFGHEKGAFTGANARKIGKFELANKGTLFLDEIECLTHEFQAKLLRVLEEKHLTRVGGTSEIEIDVRIIAASNRSLRQEVKSGRFRDDLFYRIHGVKLDCPPLRERREDIPKLVDYFFKKQLLRSRNKEQKFGNDAIQIMKNYDWPGNVRELKNTVERIMILVQDNVIHSSHLNFLNIYDSAKSRFDDVLSLPYKEARDTVLQNFQKSYVRALLNRHEGNYSRAAEEAQLPRTSLYRMVKANDL